MEDAINKPQGTAGPFDGDWCLVDLSDDITEQATNWAHATGMDFHAFMLLALEEKMARLAEDADLKRKMEGVQWVALLSPKQLRPAHPKDEIEIACLRSETRGIPRFEMWATCRRPSLRGIGILSPPNAQELDRARPTV